MNVTPNKDWFHVALWPVIRQIWHPKTCRLFYVFGAFTVSPLLGIPEVKVVLVLTPLSQSLSLYSYYSKLSIIKIPTWLKLCNCLKSYSGDDHISPVYEHLCFKRERIVSLIDHLEKRQNI